MRKNARPFDPYVIDQIVKLHREQRLPAGESAPHSVELLVKSTPMPPRGPVRLEGVIDDVHQLQKAKRQHRPDMGAAYRDQLPKLQFKHEIVIRELFAEPAFQQALTQYMAMVKRYVPLAQASLASKGTGDAPHLRTQDARAALAQANDAFGTCQTLLHEKMQPHDIFDVTLLDLEHCIQKRCCVFLQSKERENMRPEDFFQGQQVQHGLRSR